MVRNVSPLETLRVTKKSWKEIRTSTASAAWSASAASTATALTSQHVELLQEAAIRVTERITMRIATRIPLRAL